MTSTLNYLTSDSGFTSSILNRIEQYSYPGCLELRWDAPACGIMTEDTGIALKAGSHFIVISLLKDQLRYFAASENADEVDYEIGILPDARRAGSFIEDYLVHKRELLAILTPRRILQARLEAEGECVIERPNTDTQDHRLYQK